MNNDITHEWGAILKHVKRSPRGDLTMLCPTCMNDTKSCICPITQNVGGADQAEIERLQSRVAELEAALSVVPSKEVDQQSESIEYALGRLDDELHGANYGLYVSLHNVLSENTDLLQRLDREVATLRAKVEALTEGASERNPNAGNNDV